MMLNRNSFDYICIKYLFFFQVWDWDKESIPLEDIGDPGPPNFIGATDKHSTDEGTIINHVLVVCCIF